MWSHTMEYYLAIRNIQSCHLWQHGQSERYYAKWNNSQLDKCDIISNVEPEK